MFLTLYVTPSYSTFDGTVTDAEEPLYFFTQATPVSITNVKSPLLNVSSAKADIGARLNNIIKTSTVLRKRFLI